MLVADASVLVKVLTLEKSTDEARTLLIDADYVAAPDFVTLEIASALSKKVRYFGLPREQALASLEAIPRFVTEFVPFDDLIPPGFDLSIQLKHAIQDCMYLALAVEKECLLATSDFRFVKRARAAGFGDRIVALGGDK